MPGERSGNDSAGWPPLVRRAVTAAGDFALTRADAGPGQPSACLPGVGRVLAMLAAGCPGGRIAEIGTGAGIGTAWLVSGLPEDATLISVDIDPGRAAAAARLFAGDDRITLRAGDGREILPPLGPFDLVFADGGPPGRDLVDLIRVGGCLVMDDVTPLDLLPPDSPWRDRDPKRDLFADSRLAAAEIVLPDLRHALLAGTRRD